MKSYFVLIILAITLAFFSGRIAFMVSGEEGITSKEITFIHSLIQELQERISPTYTFNLRIEYPNQSYLELLSPGGLYRSSDMWQPNSTSCFEVIRNRQTLSNLSKENVWDSFRCHLINSLPEDFFETPPYIHSTGRSYAYLAFNFYPTKYRYKAWFRDNIQFFQIGELKDLSLELPPTQRFLVELTPNETFNIINGVRFFLTDKYVLINNGFLHFDAYPLKMADIIFGRSGYELSKTQSISRCYYKIGQLCVSKRKEKLINRLSETSILIFIAAIIILFMIATILFNKIRKQNLEDERKKHALRVLTHELRTPIASLLLQIENITDNSRDFSSQTQEKLLRIESDVYRLKHLAEKSRDYLQSDSSAIIQFNNIQLNSINLFIQEIIEEIKTSYPNIKIEFKPQSDVVIELDPYWVHICVSNLIDNARRYGKGIIKVSTFMTEKFLEISVIDQGTIFNDKLSKIINKQTEISQGMGIGLKIVKKTVQEMGGDLLLTTHPTTFTIKIPFKSHKKKR